MEICVARDHEYEEGDEGESYGFVAMPSRVCTDPVAYGHRSRWEVPQTERAEPTQEERAEAAAERRRVVANNKAWRSAEAVRREWLTVFCTRKSAPKGAARFLAESLLRADYCLSRALERRHSFALETFGTAVTCLAGASDSRAQMAGLNLVLAAYEADTGTHSWRSVVQESTARYLAYLASQGYELSLVERLACGDEAAAM